MREIRSPRDAAKDLIRRYVERGDDPDWIRSTGMGSYSRFYCAHVGGYLYADGPYVGKPLRKLAADQVGVDELHGTRCNAVFSLADLWREIERENETGLRQGSLFDALQEAV